MQGGQRGGGPAEEGAGVVNNYSTEAGVADLERRWRHGEPFKWECWCGRRLGCPAALDAHQLDHATVDLGEAG